MKNKKISTLTLSALLCAIGIIIPLFSPFKILIEPASFTLGSHVAIMIAMMISPQSAILVSIGTSIGFLLSGFPLIVVLRALTHIVFAYLGAKLIQKDSQILTNQKKGILFALFIALIHALSELIIVSLFYFSSTQLENYVYQVLILVGCGTLIHSIIDYIIAKFIYALLPKKLITI